jgi:mannose-1-phosphate guanylyltransferase/mannose-6-phosphate isomerase
VNILEPVVRDSATQAQAARRFAIVLAGGSGSRLWPLSRTGMPKQLLCLNGSESLMQDTARRLLAGVEPGNVFTVTHKDHRFEVAGQLHSVDQRLAENVLVEPVGRNTLPAIAWAAARIARISPNALVSVFSSDHAISDTKAFLAAWETAEIAAAQGHIVLLGMRPTEPKTGFGYIQSGSALPGRVGTLGAQSVLRFVEKPEWETAKRFVAEGGYYWNGGIFVFRADTFLAMLERHQPAIHQALGALGECGKEAPASLYAGLPDISIDYGVLEQADRVAVVPVSMGWSDLGSWNALYEQRDKDVAGNMVHGDVIPVDSRNNLLWSEHGVIATLGLQDVAVVQTRDATLVCPRDATENLKDLVAEVKRKHRHLTELHLTVTRPWGSYTVLEEGNRYKIKRIVVNPGQKLSMQMHHHRSEHWVVIAGTARIVNGDQEIYLHEDESTYIPKTNRHRLENPGRIPLQIIEIQSGPYLEEDDIVRFDDVYGRT